MEKLEVFEIYDRITIQRRNMQNSNISKISLIAIISLGLLLILFLSLNNKSSEQGSTNQTTKSIPTESTQESTPTNQSQTNPDLDESPNQVNDLPNQPSQDPKKTNPINSNNLEETNQTDSSRQPKTILQSSTKPSNKIKTPEANNSKQASYNQTNQDLPTNTYQATNNQTEKQIKTPSQSQPAETEVINTQPTTSQTKPADEPKTSTASNQSLKPTPTNQQTPTGSSNPTPATDNTNPNPATNNPSQSLNDDNNSSQQPNNNPSPPKDDNNDPPANTSPPDNNDSSNPTPPVNNNPPVSEFGQWQAGGGQGHHLKGDWQAYKLDGSGKENPADASPYLEIGCFYNYAKLGIGVTTDTFIVNYYENDDDINNFSRWVEFGYKLTGQTNQTVETIFESDWNQGVKNRSVIYFFGSTAETGIIETLKNHNSGDTFYVDVVGSVDTSQAMEFKIDGVKKVIESLSCIN